MHVHIKVVFEWLFSDVQDVFGVSFTVTMAIGELCVAIKVKLVAKILGNHSNVAIAENNKNSKKQKQS